MLLTIPISAAERRGGTMDPIHRDRAVSALRSEGCVVLADAIDPTPLERLRERMERDLPGLCARADAPYQWNRGHLQHPPPRDPAWLIPELIANAQAIAVTSALLGRPDNALYTGNTALARSRWRQPVHTDFGHLWPAAAGVAPAHGIVVNVPLVDMDPGTGATEIWPGSHQDARMQEGACNEVPAEALAQRRRFAPPEPACARVGSIVLRDVRLWHAGMPNPSPRPRPMIAMLHWCAWYAPAAMLDFPRAAGPLLQHPVLRDRVRLVDQAVDPGAAERLYRFAPDAAPDDAE